MRSNTPKYDAAMVKLSEFIALCRKNEEALLSLDLQPSTGNPFDVRVNANDLAKKLGISGIMGNKLRNDGEAEPLLDLLRERGVVREGLPCPMCNILRQIELFKHYVLRDVSAFNAIKLINGKVSYAAIDKLEVTRRSGLNGLGTRLGHYDADWYDFAVEQKSLLCDWVLEQMIEMGLFDPGSFISYTDKAEDRAERVERRGKTIKERFDQARQREDYTHSIVSLGNISDFSALFNLFALASKRVASGSSIGNFSAGFNAFREYLEHSGVDGDEDLSVYLNDYTSPRFRNYIEDVRLGKTISAAQASTYVSVVNLVLGRLKEFKEFETVSFIHASGFAQGGRDEKGAYAPYTKEEREAISGTLNELIQGVVRSRIEPYIKSPATDDFYDYSTQRLQHNNLSLESLKSWFDNECNAQAIYFGDEQAVSGGDPRRVFLRALAYMRAKKGLGKSIADLFELWGVHNRKLERRDLAPFFYRFVQVTGMNPSSVADLEIDDFVESHEATNRPCLRYWKVRSGGAKELHLDLFKCDITWLTANQATDVKELFSQVLAITQFLRDRLPEGHENKNKLWLIGPRKRQVTACSVNSFNHDQVKGPVVQSIFERTGMRVSVVATRFRSSFVSELIDKGVSLREIQLMLGHANIRTTLNYLDRLDFNKQARKRIQKTLQTIYENSFENKDDKLIPLQNVEKLVHSTPLGGCKNIFDPPDFIKKSKGWKEGAACSNLNKCLVCDNVIVTISHLPSLFALYRDYKEVARNGSIMTTPHGGVIKDNIDVLESLLGDSSEFSQEELHKAQRLSLSVESTILIDGVSQ